MCFRALRKGKSNIEILLDLKKTDRKEPTAQSEFWHRLCTSVGFSLMHALSAPLNFLSSFSWSWRESNSALVLLWVNLSITKTIVYLLWHEKNSLQREVQNDSSGLSSQKDNYGNTRQLVHVINLFLKRAFSRKKSI